MIPVLRLDPASLTLWYDPGLISQNSNSLLFVSAIEAAWDGDSERLKSLISDTNDPSARVRAVHLASAVWHEQRHFVDLVLTNYGAGKFRDFVRIYANQPGILDALRSSQTPVVFPISAYRDPIALEILGVREPPPAVLELADHVTRQGRASLQERRAISLASGTLIEPGGDAQLEAIAYVCQIAAIQECFGPAMAKSVQADMSLSPQLMVRYKWAISLANRLGLASAKQLPDGTPQVDLSFLGPILIAALMTRRWRKRPDMIDLDVSRVAADRLALLLQTYQTNRDRLGDSVLSCWDSVNEAATELWHVSIVEELADDFDREDKWCEQVQASDALDSVKAVAEDFHRLRATLIRKFADDPVSVLDPFSFARNMLPWVRPIPIVASAAGVAGEAPDGLETVLSYKDPTADGPDARFWWAAAPDWPHGDDSLLVVRERDAWLDVVAREAPLAKLMMHGRAHRTMLGPELLVIERQLANLGYRILFDPRFAYPRQEADPTSIYYLSGKNEIACDFCRARLSRPDGFIVSPWTLRRSEFLARHAMDGFGGGEKGRLHFLRDWSVWVACKDCYALLGPAALRN